MTARRTYPTIDLSQANLTADELALAQGIVNSHTGCLRASKPTIVYTETDERDEFGGRKVVTSGGETAYIWRMVAFSVSPDSRHHCMPMTADFGLNGDYNERLALAKKLDAIADKIIATVPKAQWYGVTRWARAFGY
jgi:hypothetical protein